MPNKTWYGPVVATFPVQFGGNPYDPALNDVRVRFTGPVGEPIERLAYFDDSTNTWKAVLVTDHAGKYVATLYRNGEKKAEKANEGLLDASAELKGGYIQVDPFASNRFRRTDGTPYYPIGFNLGWQNPSILPMDEQIAKMGKNGVNWTRIWACNWDGKNPWWPAKEDKTPDGELWSPAFAKWDKLVAASEANGVPFQFVLFHHGLFSSKVNPNWPDHPWNAKQGGFLKEAADFFVDPEAKRRSKIWLRYAVARYGHSPAVMAWELFNEVEWVDARYANRWGDIEAWHKEMAEYVRTIDPYHHLITTSSTTDRPALWESLDYVQPHTYPPSIFAAIVGSGRPIAKPGFYGEFGPDDMNPKKQPMAVRDGIIGGMLANDAGAGQFWYWEAVEQNNLYDQFKIASEVYAKSDIYNHPSAKPIQLTVSTEGTADLTLSPGFGWGKATVTEFRLPEDATMAKQNGFPGYFQSQVGDNKELFPTPLTLRFNAKVAGVARVRLNQISKGGAKLALSVNGKTVTTKEYPAGDGERSTSDVLEAPFGPGEQTIVLANSGADWVRLSNITVSHLASQATVTAMSDARWMFMRVTGATLGTAESRSKTVTLGAIPLGEGKVKVMTINLESGETTESTATVTAGRMSVPLMNDSVIVVTKL